MLENHDAGVRPPGCFERGAALWLDCQDNDAISEWQSPACRDDPRSARALHFLPYGCDNRDRKRWIAAVGGNARDAKYLGELTLRTRPELARQWFVLAAEGGNLGAAKRLQNLFKDPEDSEIKERSLLLLAESGDRSAQIAVGWDAMLRGAFGKAEAWFSRPLITQADIEGKSARREIIVAHYYLGLLERKRQNYTAARAHFLVGAKQEFTESMYELALLARLDGRESTEYWYLRKAAKRNHKSAIDAMEGIIERDGPDDDESEEW